MIINEIYRGIINSVFSLNFPLTKYDTHNNIKGLFEERRVEYSLGNNEIWIRERYHFYLFLSFSPNNPYTTSCVHGLSLRITEQLRERVAPADTRAAIKGVKAFYRIARHARMLITLMNIYSIAACNLSQAASQRAAVA